MTPIKRNLLYVRAFLLSKLRGEKMKWFKVSLSGFFLVGFIFWFSMGYVIKQGQKPVADGTANYAIILGAKVKNDGTPSKALKYRLDAAYEYAKKYPHVHFVLSGGQGTDEFEAEAVAMQRYLIQRGINKNRLLLETKSTSTYENIRFSTAMIPLGQSRITIISSDFHLARAQLIATHLGISNCDVVAAKTPKSVAFKLHVRERVGLIFQRLQLWR